MAIDFATVKNLELVKNLQSDSNKANSLFAHMNHTATAVGARLLIAQILQPPTDEDTINMRLDAVESILNNEESYFQTAGLLGRLTNLDSLINTLVAKPKKMTTEKTKACIRTIISLQHVITLVSQLGKAVSNFEGSRTCCILLFSFVLYLTFFYI